MLPHWVICKPPPNTNKTSLPYKSLFFAFRSPTRWKAESLSHQIRIFHHTFSGILAGFSKVQPESAPLMTGAPAMQAPISHDIEIVGYCWSRSFVCWFLFVVVVVGGVIVGGVIVGGGCVCLVIVIISISLLLLLLLLLLVPLLLVLLLLLLLFLVLVLLLLYYYYFYFYYSYYYYYCYGYYYYYYYYY